MWCVETGVQTNCIRIADLMGMRGKDDMKAVKARVDMKEVKNKEVRKAKKAKATM